MKDQPMRKNDVIETPMGLICSYEVILSAKRLLKKKIYDLSYDDHDYYMRLIKAIDACFQIPD